MNQKEQRDKLPQLDDSMRVQLNRRNSIFLCSFGTVQTSSVTYLIGVSSQASTFRLISRLYIILEIFLHRPPASEGKSVKKND